ncbi:MAG: acyl carrier protein [Neisseriaceae bacterium]|nr:acyl carrier protein [Neisseriaceae bacterium]MBR7002558.1 acyl carrier protein [Neisseriaceae bacterium]
MTQSTLEYQLKSLILQECDRLDHLSADDIANDEPLFGEESRVGLDSLDAVQIAVALQAKFGVRMASGAKARRHLQNIASLAAFIRKEQGQ